MNARLKQIDLAPVEAPSVPRQYLNDASKIASTAHPSPARAYQEAIAQAWSEQPEAKYPPGVRLLVLVGGAVAAWGAIFSAGALLFG